MGIGCYFIHNSVNLIPTSILDLYSKRIYDYTNEMFFVACVALNLPHVICIVFQSQETESAEICGAVISAGGEMKAYKPSD